MSSGFRPYEGWQDDVATMVAPLSVANGDTYRRIEARSRLAQAFEAPTCGKVLQHDGSPSSPVLRTVIEDHSDATGIPLIHRSEVIRCVAPKGHDLGPNPTRHEVAGGVWR